MAAGADPASRLDFAGALRELFDTLLESEERVVFITRARYLTTDGSHAPATGEIQESDPGLLALTDGRVLFVGVDDERFALARADIRAATIEPSGAERLRLRLATGWGVAVVTDIPAGDASGLEALQPQAPRAVEPDERVGALPAAAAVAAVGASVALWTIAANDVDPRQVGSLGLVAELPLTAFLALALLTCSFCATLARRAFSAPLLLLHVAALVFMVYGVTTIVEEVPSINVSWRHAGVARYVMETGEVDRAIDAYSNWPGFFVVLALATDLAGKGDPIALAGWAPVLFNLLYLPALVSIGRSLRADQRLVWASVWVFYLANWVRQDYLAPQALVYVLYLALLAALLSWFPGRGEGSPRGRRWPGSSALARLAARWPAEEAVAAAARVPPGRRGAIFLACVVLVAAVAPTHQLTPFAVIFAVAALVVLGQCSLRGLPLIVAVLTAAWVTFFTAPYLTGHLDQVGGQLGRIGGTVSQNVGERVGGSSEHVTIVSLRIVFAALLWALATWGAIRWLRRRRDGLGLVALAVAPFTLVFLQAYGGEILLRVYLFQLPALALLVASLVVPAKTKWRTGIGLAALSTVLIAGLLFTRYGNDRILMFTKAEVQAIDRLYDAAPPDSVLVAPSNNLAWQGQGYGAYRHVLMNEAFKTGQGSSPAALADRLARYMTRREAPAAFLVITRSVRNYDAEFGSAPWGKVSDLELGVSSSPRFERIYANPDGAVYKLTPARGAGG